MRVERVFAFVDLCGFTRFTDLHGDEDAVLVLADFRAAIREISSRRGVRVAKWLGDGAMFVAIESEALFAAVLEMEQRLEDGRSPLALRAGLSRGRVILFEGDDYIGSAVNLAARLCDDAQPHQILAPRDLASSVPRWAEASPAGPVVVRGFARPVEVTRVHRRQLSIGGIVTDPICGMHLPADSISVTRSDSEHGVVPFCSESCAIAWSGGTGAPIAAEA